MFVQNLLLGNYTIKVSCYRIAELKKKKSIQGENDELVRDSPLPQTLFSLSHKVKMSLFPYKM